MDNLLVDSTGGAIADASGAVGRHAPGIRMVWALPPTGSGLTRRYGTHPPSESALFGMDFSFVLCPDVAIVSASLAILVNEAPPVATTDWTIGPVSIEGSAVFARLSGGIAGTDYQFQWSVTDGDGNVWPRTALVLCAQTS